MHSMEEGNYEFRSDFNERYNVVTRKILRALSENSRVSISDLAKSLGISRMTARLKLKRVAEEFNIHYTVEFNENLLRLVAPHLIAVKFEKKPDYAHVARLLSQTHIPQIAVSMRGGYDMLVYAVARTTREYAHWDKSMQILLSEYGVDWKPSGLSKLGFPIKSWGLRRLTGNVFFAVGTEDFAQLSQIGSFSSQTYGGGLRLQLTPRQDVTAYGGFQQRTQDHTDTSFGWSYGIRF